MALSCGRRNYLCYNGHPGTDYPVPNGTPVYAAAAGVAHLPSSFPGISNAQSYNAVEIDHGNGYKTYYLHLSSQSVSEGQSVSTGQLIGYSGDTGSAGSCHLHFEVQRNSIPVDPYGWQGPGADPYTRAVNTRLWAVPFEQGNHFEFSFVPSPQTVGNPFSMTITAKDANGNTKTDWKGTVYLSSTNGGLSLAQAMISSGGSTTVKVSVNTPGNFVQLKAQAGGMSGTSNVFDVGGGCTTSVKGSVKQYKTSLNGAVVSIFLACPVYRRCIGDDKEISTAS